MSNLYAKLLAERPAPGDLIDTFDPRQRERLSGPLPPAVTEADHEADDLVAAFVDSENLGYVISVETGEPVEPDHPDSPLSRAGLI